MPDETTVYHALLPNDIHLVYPTPILARQVPNGVELSRRLREIVLARRDQDPGVTITNVGGWQSAHDLFSWPHPEVGELMRAIGESVHALMAEGSEEPGAAAGIRAVGWANVNGPGAYNRPHTHPGSMWSGVYYVDPGDRPEGDEASGLIEFLDPRAGVDMLEYPGLAFSDTFKIEPVAGLLVVFPSWLVHYVNAHHGARSRISLAFNVRVVPQE